MRIFILIFLCLASSTWAKPKFSGMTWGNANFPKELSGPEAENIGTDFNVKMQMDLGWQLAQGQIIPFLYYFGQQDTLGFAYNHKQQVALGLEWHRKLGDYHAVSVGGAATYDYRPLTGAQYIVFDLRADYNYWRTWQRERGRRILSGWAQLRYPGSADPWDLKNLLIKGQARLTQEWPLGKKQKYHAGVFGALGAGTDTKGHPYNNKIQMDFGAQIKTKVKKLEVTLAARYRMEHRWLDGVTDTGPLLTLSWFRRY